MAQKNEPEKKKKKGPKIIIIAALVVLLLFAGVGIGAFVLSDKEEGSFFSRFTSEAEASETFIPLEEFLINLKSESKNSEPVIKMELTITSMIEDAEEVITKDIAKVRDAVIHVVSNKNVESIYNEEEGHFLIKEDIKARINQELDEEIIEDVYITNILLQK